MYIPYMATKQQKKTEAQKALVVKALKGGKQLSGPDIAKATGIKKDELIDLLKLMRKEGIIRLCGKDEKLCELVPEKKAKSKSDAKVKSPKKKSAPVEDDEDDEDEDDEDEDEDEDEDDDGDEDDEDSDEDDDESDDDDEDGDDDEDEDDEDSDDEDEDEDEDGDDDDEDEDDEDEDEDEDDDEDEEPAPKKGKVKSKKSAPAPAKSKGKNESKSVKAKKGGDKATRRPCEVMQWKSIDQLSDKALRQRIEESKDAADEIIKDGDFPHVAEMLMRAVKSAEKQLKKRG